MCTKFTALTVQEGDAFLLEDNGFKCLFDSGKYKTIVELLKYKGIDKLDLAICSHNDADHANGFIELLKSGIQIKEIWLPGLWASILLFVKENCNKESKVEWDDNYNGELDSLFSNKSMTCDSFNSQLSYCVEMIKSNCFHFAYDMVSYLDRNTSFLADFLYHDSQSFLKERNVDNYSDFQKEFLFLLKERQNHSRNEIIQRHCIDFLDFKLNKIIDIAHFAKRCGCIIRWFEPTSACSNEIIDYGFVSLNSKKMCIIKEPKNYMACLRLIKLTEENIYSLLFEYTKNDVPLIRFSADSNSTCQSVYPYFENIIVTAPHHGSAANANVYNSIQGNDIIWVRSDRMYYKRPCQEFKQQQNKYCLACQRFNFISEICFEYNTWYKKWDYIRGERCRCK